MTESIPIRASVMVVVVAFPVASFGGIVAMSFIHFPKNIKKEGGSIKKIKVSMS